MQCGAPVRAPILPAPGWKVPVAIVVGVVAVSVIVLVLVVNSLSSSATSGIPAALSQTSAGSSTSAALATHHRAHTSPATTTPTTTTTTLASWPKGVMGYTVVLDVTPSKSSATASARKAAATGIPAGLLFSSDYSSMTPGDWIVFSGTYTSRAEASAAATRLHAKGQPGAYEFSVVPATHTAGTVGSGKPTTATPPATVTTPAANTTTPARVNAPPPAATTTPAGVPTGGATP